MSLTWGEERVFLTWSEEVSLGYTGRVEGVPRVYREGGGVSYIPEVVPRRYT